MLLGAIETRAPHGCHLLHQAELNGVRNRNRWSVAQTANPAALDWLHKDN